MTMYGYARVSSKDQNLNRQLDALSAVGVSEESVFVDHLSGRNFDRPGNVQFFAHFDSRIASR